MIPRSLARGESVLNKDNLFMLFVELFLIIAFVLGLAFVRAKALVWTIVLAVLLVVFSLSSLRFPGLIIPAWILFLGAAFFAHASLFRRRYITRFLMSAFRRVLPEMSATEKEALDAGTVWWEGELFQGNPNWKTLHQYEIPTLTEEERAFVDNQTTTLCRMLDDWAINREGDLPQAVWQYMKQEGFFGMLIPKEFGGHGFSPLAQSTIVTKVATASVTAAITVMVPNSLGPAELLLHYGTKAQQEHYLPRLAVGEEIPCFALTSLDAGSDAGAMLDRGVVCKGEHEGKTVLGMRLNWDKRYITLCPVATILGLAFKLYDPEHLLGDKEELGITCALIPTDHPGVEVGDRHFPMYLAFMNGPTRGKDVFVPLDWIIGGQKMAGKGWTMLMECLAVGRAMSLPALSAAGGKHYYKMTGAYARLRKQFRVSVGRFEGVSLAMADIAGKTYMTEAVRVMTVSALHLDAKPAVASAIAKYHLTEMCRQITNHAMDIHSGRAIQAGPNNYVLNGYVMMPVAITVEGANILTRNLIIYGQGGVRCHPYIYQEMQALMDKDQDRGLKKFDRLLVKHIGYGISNCVRSFLLGLTNAAFLTPPYRDFTQAYYRQMTRMSTALALVSDLAMLTLGGELKRKEGLSARLGDVLSYLYVGSAVLKYYRDNNDPTPEEHQHVKWAMQHCLYMIQEAFFGFFENFPIRWMAASLRCIIFPYGRRYRLPTDKLAHQLTTTMMSPGVFRDRLAQYTFSGEDESTATGRVEKAFRTMVELAPTLKKIDRAVSKKIISRDACAQERVAQALKADIITANEATAVLAFDELLKVALAVDDFKAGELYPENQVKKHAKPKAARKKQAPKQKKVSEVDAS
jgi:acyl-CoA dehydrogenase